MRITLRLVLSVIVAAGVVALGFTLIQVKQEKVRLRADLERRTALLAESLGETVESLVEQSRLTRLQRIVEKFGNREKLAGVAVYDNAGTSMAVTSTLAAKFTAPPEIVFMSMTAKREMGNIVRTGQGKMFVFVLPLHSEQSEEHVIGALVLFHDAAYIQDRLWQIWRHNFLRLLVQALLISLTTLVIVRWTLIGPMRRMAEWIRQLRKGEVTDSSLPSSEALLHPLATEVTHLAKSLSAARASAEEEARLRQAGDSLWTPERLKEHLRTKLRGRSVFVVSNREPYSHVRRGRRIECVVPASGLVTALEPVLAACGGMWIAHGNGDADSLVVDHEDKIIVPPEEPRYTLKRVWLTKEEEMGFYYGFANEGLWPLCHIAHTRPIFRAEDWRYYQLVNAKFAKAILTELKGVDEPCVLIQDYHFALLPRLIKERRPDLRVGLF